MSGYQRTLTRPLATQSHEAPESPEGYGVRWLPVLRSSTAEGGAGNGADTALEFMARVQAKAVCALAPHPPHSKTLARDAVHGPNAPPKLEVETFHEPCPPHPVPPPPMGERVSALQTLRAAEEHQECGRL